MFSHYLLTRFNVVHNGLSQYAREQRGTIVQTDEWLKRRFELFDMYCFPSVNQQSVRNFKWLVFFNEETPLNYKKRIDDYANRCPMFHPIYVAPESDETQYAKQFILRDSSNDYIVTTRIDNDDMIHRDYIKFIQNSIPSLQKNCPGGIFLCYRWGYQYNTRRKVLLKFADNYNHFESRIERPDALQTIWVKDDRHDLISQYGNIKIISPDDVDNNSYPGMWIEVVHECNVVNNIGRGKPINIHSSDFSSHLKINHLWQLLYQVDHSFNKRIRKK